jgi:hypothetical protein
MTKKMAFCFIWIGSALVLGFLLWFFTLSYRTRLLTEKVNTVLARSGGGRIEKPLRFPAYPVSVLGGAWFELSNSSGRAFVFTIIKNGIAAACVALVDNAGNVKAIIPLSDNARQITEELPLPIYRFYADRIGRAFKNGVFK